jgi:putative inorganic carbon (HCO3(-)) transporter
LGTFGTGIGHYIPLVAYLGFLIMCFVALAWRPLYGLYYLIPFIPYRSMRDHFNDYPLGENLLTLLVFCVIVGAMVRGKRLPKSKLYITWLVIAVYLYLSMWIGTAAGIAPAPLWLSNINFVTWKDYILIPLIFAAASLVIEDRKAVRMVIAITAVSLIFIDRSCILESISRTWTKFDETKRGGGPLAFGSNQTAAFLAQSALFFWGSMQFLKEKRVKLFGYALIGLTLFATMYTFSRAGYLAVLVGVLILGILKDRKLLVLLAIFLCTWQVWVPVAVHQRVDMTTDSSGQLDASAQDRVDLWKESQETIAQHPVFGIGFATFQLVPHVHGLHDTHNWFVKVAVETGIIGVLMTLALLGQLFALTWRLYQRPDDPLYRSLGLGLFVALCVSMVSNCFGDRWTYVEITGPLWVLAGAAVRGSQLTAEVTSSTYPEREMSVDCVALRTGPLGSVYPAFERSQTEPGSDL